MDMSDDSFRKDVELIEDYLEGRLTDESVELVQERLEKDSDFYRIYKLVKNLPITLRKSNLQNLLGRLQSLEDELPGE